MNIGDVFNLFQNAAEEHGEILHSTSDMHFGRVMISADEFANDDIEELVGKAGTSLKFPAVFVGAYNFEILGNDSNQWIKRSPISVWVLDRADSDSFDDRQTAQSRCERIALELLSYVRNYFENNVAAGRFKHEFAGGEALAKVVQDRVHGCRLDLFIDTFMNSAVAYDSDKFTGTPTVPDPSETYDAVTFYKTLTLTDGDTVDLEAGSAAFVQAIWTVADGATARTLAIKSPAQGVIHVAGYKTGADDLVITLDATEAVHRFREGGDFATTPEITIEGDAGSFFELNGKVTGFTSAGLPVIAWEYSYNQT